MANGRIKRSSHIIITNGIYNVPLGVSMITVNRASTNEWMILLAHNYNGTLNVTRLDSLQNNITYTTDETTIHMTYYESEFGVNGYANRSQPTSTELQMASGKAKSLSNRVTQLNTITTDLYSPAEALYANLPDTSMVYTGYLNCGMGSGLYIALGSSGLFNGIFISRAALKAYFVFRSGGKNHTQEVSFV